MTVTITTTDYGTRAILHPDGRPVQAGDLRNGQMIHISTDSPGGNYFLDTRNRKERRAAAAKARRGRG